MPVAKPRKNNAASGFTFINVAHPDEIRQRSTQRAIRSGAMATIGRSRRKRPERPVIIELNMLQREGANGNAQNGLAIGETYRAFPARQGIPPTLLHLGIYPIEPGMRERELLHFMSGEASHIYRPFRLEWFSMALLDPSSYYLSLANAALFMDQYFTHRTSLAYTNTVESTKYFSKCLTLVTGQLACHARSKVISEGVITTVLGFACHSFTIKNWDLGEMHMQGLERIIRLRGGLQGLGDLVPLFVSWFDITNSAIQDTPPRFPYPVSMVDVPTSLEELPSTLVPLLSRLDHSDFNFSPLGEALRSTAQLASYVNKHAAQQPQFWTSGVKSTRLLGPAAHCILSIPRLNLLEHLNDDKSDLNLLLLEAIRLALLILLAILKGAFSLVADELGLFSEKFSTLAPLMVGLTSFPELRLWTCIIDACAREDPIPQIQLSEIRRAMKDLQIQRSEDAVTVAKGVIWIPYLLDEEIERVKRQIE